MSNLKSGGFKEPTPHSVAHHILQDADKIKDVISLVLHNDGSSCFVYSDISVRDLVWLQANFNAFVNDVLMKTHE